MLIYIFSKFLPLLIMPLGFFIIAYLINLRNKNFITISSFFYLIILSTNIASEYIWDFLERPQIINLNKSIDKHTFGVVLGGAIVENKNNNINWIDPDKYFSGLKLLRQNKIDQLIFTGGFSPLNKKGLTEGQILKKVAISEGYPEKKILVTPPVKNTVEEVIEINKFLEKYSQGTKKIILITNAFHMHRASHLFAKKGISVTPLPVNFYTSFKKPKNYYLNPLNYFPNASSLSDSSDGLREFLARIIYTKSIN